MNIPSDSNSVQDISLPSQMWPSASPEAPTGELEGHVIERQFPKKRSYDNFVTDDDVFNARDCFASSYHSPHIQQDDKNTTPQKNITQKQLDGVPKEIIIPDHPDDISDITILSKTKKQPSTKKRERTVPNALPQNKERALADSGLCSFSFEVVPNPKEAKIHTITPAIDNYEWDLKEEAKMPVEKNTANPHLELPEELAEAIHSENILADWEDDAPLLPSQQEIPVSPGSVPPVEKKTVSKKRVFQDELSGATAAIEKTLQTNRALSHEKAMEIAKETLLNEGANKRTVEEKAFKSVARVFHKLLHQNSPAADAFPDAHLKNQDSFYETDVQQVLKSAYSNSNAYKKAIIHAGQRSFYFNPKQNIQEAENQAKTGMRAAHDYFIRKGVPPASLPTIQELFPEMMKTSILR